MSLVHDLLRAFEPEIQSLELIPSDGGRFEVTVNGTLIFSKKQLGRHAQPGEVVSLVQNFLERERSK